MATFTVTVPDGVVPRISAAYGLTGTPVEQKTQLEGICRDWIQSTTINYETTLAAQQHREDLSGEDWDETA
jgi:hypothetical protein